MRYIRDLARLLEVPTHSLTWYAFRLPDDHRYVTFEVPKRSGAMRQIRSPHSGLKALQRKLLQVLSAAYEPRRCVTGFVEGRSILTNAQSHARRGWLLNVDIQDFFPSINFGRVRGMFLSAPYRLPPDVATALARICCHDNQLPQGAPTSPIVANMICARMDSELSRLAADHGCRYTRFADDLSFSTRGGHFPPALATVVRSGRTVSLSIGPVLEGAIQSNGFALNPNKISIRGRGRRQMVTGLVVNDRPNVPRKFARQVRAMLHAWDRYGYVAAQEEYRARFLKRHQRLASLPSFREVVRGKLAFLSMVRGEAAPIYTRLWGEFQRLQGRSVDDGLWVLEALYDTTDGPMAEQGSAFMLEGVGMVTCAHVLRPETKAFRWQEPATQYDVRILHRQDEIDLAIIAIDVERAHRLPMSVGDAVRRGDEVSVAGFPNYAPGNHPYLAVGRVSQLRPHGGIQWATLSAEIVKGGSGGPVLNGRGQVVGVACKGGEYAGDRSHDSRAVLIEALTELLRYGPDGQELQRAQEETSPQAAEGTASE